MVANIGPKFRVLIATPIQDGKVWCETAVALLRIAIQDGEVPGLEFVWETFGGMGVAVARNELAWMALSRKFNGVLFWDSDVIGKPHDILGLVRHGKHLVGGLYPHKSGKQTWVANFIPGEVPDKNGALKVEDCGAGFLFCSCQVLQAIIAKKLVKHYTRGFAIAKPPGTVMHDFFSMGVINDPMHNDEPTYKTEDFMLAHWARLAGFACYVDTQVRVHHLGLTTYRADAPGLPEPWKTPASAPSVGPDPK